MAMTKNALEEQVLQQAQSLWAPSTSLVVAVSGGADSMALYALLRAIHAQWPAPLYPVHIDHQLREHSSEEAHWLQEYFLQVFDKPLRVISVVVHRERGESLEMAARRCRYQALYGVLHELPRDSCIVTAHQQDDQVETVLMRFLQGTGIRGLQGMKSRRGAIVRPLLTVTRTDLEHYLESRQLTWQHDPSNDDLSFARNRLRHQIIPYLEEQVNPRLRLAVIGLGSRAEHHQSALDYLMEHWTGRDAVHEDENRLQLDASWKDWPEEVATLYLRTFAEHRGLRVTATHLEDALKGDTDWPRRWRVYHGEQGTLEVVQESTGMSSPPPPMMRLPFEGKVTWGDWEIDIVRTVFHREMPGIVISATRFEELWIRGWRPGDRMRPLGLNGHSKKVQDIFVDQKVPRALREHWPLVLANSGGPILALLGIAIAEDARAAIGSPVFQIGARPKHAISKA